MRCDVCKVEAPRRRLVVDHLLPRSHDRFNAEANLRLVHQRCLPKQPLWRRIMRQIGRWRYKLQMFIDRKFK